MHILIGKGKVTNLKQKNFAVTCNRLAGKLMKTLKQVMSIVLCFSLFHYAYTSVSECHFILNARRAYMPTFSRGMEGASSSVEINFVNDFTKPKDC